MNEILTGHRNEAWRIDVFNNDDQYLHTLDGAIDGSYDFSIHDTIRSGGSITYAGKQEINWNEVRLQPWYILRDRDDNEVMSWPLGMFIPSTPSSKYDGTGREVEIELYDKLLVLDQDKFENTWSYPKGQNITDAIRDLIISAGEDKVAMVESEHTLSTAMVWEAGTTKLQVINELLDTINYFSLWVDGYGIYRAEPYDEPQRRGIAWEFFDNEESIYAEEFEHEADTFNVPNRVVLVSKSEGEEAGFVARADNEDPDSPFSYQRRGRWIVQFEKDVEAATPDILGEIAARRLVEASQVTSTFEIDVAPLNLDLNAVVLFRNIPANFDVRAVVQKMNVTMGVGDLMTLTLRQVV